MELLCLLNSKVEYTDGIRERIVQDVIERSYDRAIEQHRKTCSGIVGKRQAMQLAESASCDFVDFYAHRAVKDEQTDDLLILSFDGKGLVMLPSEGMHPKSGRKEQEQPADKA